MFHANAIIEILRKRINVRLESSDEAIGLEILGEIGLVERHEILAEDNKHYLHRIDYVSKLKRNIFPCASE